MADIDFVTGFANPANKSKKVTLKSSKKLNKPKEKVISTDKKIGNVFYAQECILNRAKNG